MGKVAERVRISSPSGMNRNSSFSALKNSGIVRTFCGISCTNPVCTLRSPEWGLPALFPRTRGSMRSSSRAKRALYLTIAAAFRDDQ
jgi:hypothetical protein